MYVLKDGVGSFDAFFGSRKIVVDQGTSQEDLAILAQHKATKDLIEVREDEVGDSAGVDANATVEEVAVAGEEGAKNDGVGVVQVISKKGKKGGKKNE